ncbi:MAG TPA: SDR family oxidoreductase [Thermoleophilaceae bacterium]|nr:SDR family oxidoreductase [Thermoleophilaceae bacterium]
MSRAAIVTASDSGIGKATAIRLAADGFDVGITWHTDEPGAADTARQVEEQGRRAVVTRLDVTRFEEAGETIARLASELGRLDVLVNNAGGGPGHPFLEYPLDEFQEVVDLNLTGAFVCAQRAARIMVDDGTQGRIINVTSVHEHIPLPKASAYCAAKGGLGLLTKTMALELGEHGITVNAVAPGEIATEMTGAEDVDPGTLERPALPAGRPGHAEEIAAAVSFLASPDARYTTGASFVVDGGLTLTAAKYNQATASS